MLEVPDLHAYYGKSHISRGQPSIGEGEIVSLLGRNGVGRSTTIKAIMGLVQRDGSIVFKGREISRATSFGSPDAASAMSRRIEISFPP